MKKKILFTLLLAACFVCLLIVSVGAVTYTYNDADGNMLFSFDYETTATNYGGTPNAFIASNKQGNGFDKVDAQGNELTWYITNSQTDDAGNKTFTVASLKTVGEAGTINENGVYNFTSPVTNKNTVSVNFPDNAGIKTWGFKSFGGYNSYFNNNILFVYCPNTLTAFENNPFQETPVMVVELEFETPINNIPQNFAHEARNLTSINIPASVEIINGNGTNQGTPFYRNYSLASVNFAPNSVLTTIKQNAFTDCNSLTSLVLPNSVTTIAERAFAACRNLTTIKLGASLKETTGFSVFHTCNSLTIYYIPKTLKTVSQHTFTHDGTAGPSYGVFFYNGTKEELDDLVEIAVASKNNNRLTNQYNPDNKLTF
ncbi:MAG: leucine-rich repeat domain-containing protein [Ruminococcaceae bacterium]|nr:leucine-rich repeat domain-containing protein [Oscillospiraceae bacterium]